MPKCPHCGEPVDKGQEVCFACGLKVRSRARRGDPGMGPAVYLIAIAIIVLGGVGIIIGMSGSRRQDAKLRQQAEEQRVQDSVRRANRARSDTARTQAVDKDVALATVELDKLETRLATVTTQVVKDRPSPAQQQLINKIRSEISRLRQVAATFDATPQAQKPQLRTELRDGARHVRDMISNLSRMPRT
jgi:sensor domain CHASE-containing protein